MLNIIVRNSKKLSTADKRRPGYAYVGRPTVLGNPFSHLHYAKNTTLVANPGEAVKAYETWIRKEIVNGNDQILDALFSLYEVAVSGSLELACWCKDEVNPSAQDHECHADIIRKLIIEEHEVQMEKTYA